MVWGRLTYGDHILKTLRINANIFWKHNPFNGCILRRKYQLLGIIFIASAFWPSPTTLLSYKQKILLCYQFSYFLNFTVMSYKQFLYNPLHQWTILLLYNCANYYHLPSPEMCDAVFDTPCKNLSLYEPSPLNVSIIFPLCHYNLCFLLITIDPPLDNLLYRTL